LDDTLLHSGLQECMEDVSGQPPPEEGPGFDSDALGEELGHTPTSARRICHSGQGPLR
jgi:hypothetical protein